MIHPRNLFIVVVCALLLPACASTGSSPTRIAQPVVQPAYAQEESPTVTPEASAALLASSDQASAPHFPPVNCPVTTPPEPAFTPPAPYPQQPPGDYFWYGSTSLWTALPQNGVWAELPHNPEGYTQKVFWWREGYSWTEEPEPELSVIGQRLDDPAPPLNVSRATNAFAADIQSAMLVGVDFPTPGCWEITGRYAGTELSFVVWVEP
jgi:hypothetical protein